MSSRSDPAARNAKRTIETRSTDLPRSARTTLPARRVRANRALLGEVSERLMELVQKPVCGFRTGVRIPLSG